MIVRNPANSNTKYLLPIGPVGIGGWLILPLIGLIINPFLLFYYLMTDVFPYLNAETWERLTSTNGDLYHPLFGPIVIIELIYIPATILAIIALLFLFFKKKSIFPKLMMIYLGTTLILDTLTGYINLQIILSAYGNNPITSQEFTFNVLRAMLITSVWITYFSRSKRVKNTFIQKEMSHKGGT